MSAWRVGVEAQRRHILCIPASRDLDECVVSLFRSSHRLFRYVGRMHPGAGVLAVVRRIWWVTGEWVREEIWQRIMRVHAAVEEEVVVLEKLDSALADL